MMKPNLKALLVGCAATALLVVAAPSAANATGTLGSLPAPTIAPGGTGLVGFELLAGSRTPTPNGLNIVMAAPSQSSWAAAGLLINGAPSGATCSLDASHVTLTCHVPVTSVTGNYAFQGELSVPAGTPGSTTFTNGGWSFSAPGSTITSGAGGISFGTSAVVDVPAVADPVAFAAATSSVGGLLAAFSFLFFRRRLRN